jgi:hypothetical protein
MNALCTAFAVCMVAWQLEDVHELQRKYIHRECETELSVQSGIIHSVKPKLEIDLLPPRRAGAWNLKSNEIKLIKPCKRLGLIGMQRAR